MSFDIDKIDTIDIFSFSALESLKDYVRKNSLPEYDQNKETTASFKYNTRSRQCNEDSNSEEYLNKLDDSFGDYDSIVDEECVIWQARINPLTKRRTTRSTQSFLPDCGKIYCKLGCICEQTNNKSDLTKQKKVLPKHCGRFDCMFECNCARQLRSSTRSTTSNNVKTQQTEKTVLPQLTSSSLNNKLRKSKRVKHKIKNYSYLCKPSPVSEKSKKQKQPKNSSFKPYTQTILLQIKSTTKTPVKLEVLTSKWKPTQSNKLLRLISKLIKHFELLEYCKEVEFDYEKEFTIKLCSSKTNSPRIRAKICKFIPGDSSKKLKQKLLDKLSNEIVNLPLRENVNESNKQEKSEKEYNPKEEVDKSDQENVEISKQAEVEILPKIPKAKVLPRLLCRKRTSSTTSQSTNDLKNIFKSLDSLFESKKSQKTVQYSEISKQLLDFRPSSLKTEAQSRLFDDEKEFLKQSTEYTLYNPFKDEKLILETYREIDSRQIVDDVCDTLNDMIGVVCTHKQNQERKTRKIDLNEFLPSAQAPVVTKLPSFSRPNLLKRKTNIIILNKQELKQIIPNTNGKTFVKVINSPISQSITPISIVSNGIRPIVPRITTNTTSLSTFVPIRPKINTTDGLKMPNPIYKVSLAPSQVKFPILSANLLVNKIETSNIVTKTISEDNLESKKRKRKQDLSNLTSKILITDVKRPAVILPKPAKLENQTIKPNGMLNKKINIATKSSLPLMISSSLFKSGTKITNITPKTSESHESDNEIDCSYPDDDNLVEEEHLFQIKQEPTSCGSSTADSSNNDSTSTQSQATRTKSSRKQKLPENRRYFTLNTYDESDEFDLSNDEEDYSPMFEQTGSTISSSDSHSNSGNARLNLKITSPTPSLITNNININNKFTNIYKNLIINKNQINHSRKLSSSSSNSKFDSCFNSSTSGLNETVSSACDDDDFDDMDDLNDYEDEINGEKSCNSSSTSSYSSNSSKKPVSLSMHSIRERQRRLRLKNLLIKLKLTLYNMEDLDEKKSLESKAPGFKHSKQAVLAEAVDYIKSLENQCKQLNNEFNKEYEKYVHLQTSLSKLIKQEKN